MTEFVHYMAASLGRERGIAYPVEIPESNLPTVGSLFLFGRHYDDIQDTYKLHAIWGERLVLSILNRSDSNRNYYISRIKGIGVFRFLLESMTSPPEYVGSSSLLLGNIPIRRLRMLKPLDHDQACREHGFYFCGFSPSVAEDELYPLDITE